MKVEVKETGKKKEKDFPKLMANEEGTVVLFTSSGKGICLVAKYEDEYVGEYSIKWNKNIFTDFEGSITLSND